MSAKAKSYQFFHPLPGQLYEALKASIREHGVLTPITVDENGAVLDGHHRKRACAELHIDCPSVVRDDLDGDAEKEAYVISTNALRRQLTGVERSQAIARLKVLGWSTRKIGEALGVHHSTVARAGVADATPAPEPPAPEDARTPPVEPAEEGQGGGPTYSSPAPRPPVKGADGKTYTKPPTRKPKPEQTSDESYKATVWREMTRTFDGLLALDPVRAVEVTPPAEHGSLIALVERLERWSMEVRTAASTRPNLTAVSDAS